jgi:very-short-patch-repair endonuclease
MFDTMKSRAAIEESVAALAGAQHGLVTRRQLLEQGLTVRKVNYRVVSRRLRPVHRGVYAIGPALSPRMREMAAVLACGPESYVSHRSAAALWALLSPQAASAPVDVSIRGRNGGRKPGIRPHRDRLEPDEVSELDGVPVVTPARTLLDLAGQASGRELEQAFAEAERRDLVTHRGLVSLIDRYPRRQGAGTLRGLIRDTREILLTRSEAEERLLSLVRSGKLRKPESNVRIEGYEVDVCWRAERVIVEVDGFAWHSSRRTFERDRQRDGDLSAAGYRVLRVTWRQLSDEPDAVLVRLAQTLALARRP